MICKKICIEDAKNVVKKNSFQLTVIFNKILARTYCRQLNFRVVFGTEELMLVLCEQSEYCSTRTNCYVREYIATIL